MQGTSWILVHTQLPFMEAVPIYTPTILFTYILLAILG